ncbi:hypothetical protein Hanom_Chr15g01345141 [Helianthus anomalus]
MAAPPLFGGGRPRMGSPRVPPSPLQKMLSLYELMYRHYCLVEMDMIGWFCWWHDDTPVVRQ